MHSVPPENYSTGGNTTVTDRTAVNWDWRTLGRGVTAQETAERFGWSVGIAGEELDMAEEKGAVCREQGVDGVRFWENWFMRWDVEMPDPTRITEEGEENEEEREIRKRLMDSGLI